MEYLKKENALYVKLDPHKDHNTYEYAKSCMEKPKNHLVTLAILSAFLKDRKTVRLQNYAWLQTEDCFYCGIWLNEKVTISEKECLQMIELFESESMAGRTEYFSIDDYLFHGKTNENVEKKSGVNDNKRREKEAYYFSEFSSLPIGLDFPEPIPLYKVKQGYIILADRNTILDEYLDRVKNVRETDMELLMEDFREILSPIED